MNEDNVHVDTCILSTSTGKRAQIQTYAFSAESEEKTVECLGQNDFLKPLSQLVHGHFTPLYDQHF